ncbi:methylisocitrate lyase [Aquiluna borgnonia]|uniref:Methylisocitrate lyase n=1 Tax=Aquiluna borgnonia TaxID=2499157 RepID=A0A7D4QCA1_9MICO|nr:methylisocitrate lyase [Aquiluna borgnonia]QKJ25830.1 methylisocitrate lyase [Aquiluna borgnonia]
MLYSAVPAQQKRADFRAALASGKTLQFPGAFNGVSAKLIQDKGFDGVYVSGAVTSADLGLPDIGLTTLSEMSLRAKQIARLVDVPVLADADTGFGEMLNLARTIQEFEDAGVAGIHIEDQVNPKRCGHLDGKAVVDEHTATQRIASAARARRDSNFVIMARTDIRAVEGLPATLDRIRALEDAGADAIFPEALMSLDEFEAVRAATSLPILANMTEFGKGQLYTKQQLHDVGVNLVIYPVSLLRAAMGAAERALDSLRSHGTLESEVGNMQTRSRLYELLDYEGYNDFDSSIFNFKLSPDQ